MKSEQHRNNFGISTENCIEDRCGSGIYDVPARHTHRDARHESVTALTQAEETEMARQLELKGRTYWILSEPHQGGWKACVTEVRGEDQESIGIEATAGTRGAADDAAERKLRRLLRAY